MVFALDTYSTYDKVLLAGDFNLDKGDEKLQEFLYEQNFKNLVKENTCFKSIDNPSCIDLFLTNSALSFQDTTTVTTGLLLQPLRQGLYWRPPIQTNAYQCIPICINMLLLLYNQLYI